MAVYTTPLDEDVGEEPTSFIIVSKHEEQQYIIPSFCCVTVKLVRVRYKFTEQDGIEGEYDGFIRSDPLLDEVSYPSIFGVERGCFIKVQCD